MSSRRPPRPSRRFDERDTIFARMARLPGTAAYCEYYSRRRDLEVIDDRMRRMPALCGPGGRYYDEGVSGEARRYFESIPLMEPDESIVRNWKSRLSGRRDKTRVVKEMALELGAVAVGCAATDEAFVYTHKGRLDRDYGREIPAEHSNAVVFLVEMNFEEMRHAPRAGTIRESAFQYYRAAVISKTVTAVLAGCGHQARSHHDADYQVILPPLAVLAGLGELGRNNILIARRYGSRVRIGAVTTDLRLDCDTPVQLGADHFCSICMKCARNCPSRALSMGGKQDVRGVMKWPTHVERCYGYWRYAGTDCGICMAVCPFSHRDNAFHNLVRWLVRVSPWSHRLLRFLDDVFYPRKNGDSHRCPSQRSSPGWNVQCSAERHR